MRAGRLKTLATLTSAVTGALGTLWIGASSKEESDEPDALPGLLARANTTVRARYQAGIYPGLYLVAPPVTYLINSVRDPDNKGRDLLMSCTEIRGAAAVYTPLTGAAYALPAMLSQDAPRVGELVRRQEVRYLVELAHIHLNAYPRKGDNVTLEGRTFTVQGTPENGDDGVIVRAIVVPA